MRVAFKVKFRALLIGVASSIFTASASAGYVLATVDYPGAQNTQFFDVNNANVAVGYAYAGTSGFGFLYSGGAFTALAGPPGATSSFATGISDTGLIVGSYRTSAVGYPLLGYFLDAGVYTTISFGDGTDTTIRGVSSDGRYLAGTYAVDNSMGISAGFVYDRLTSTLKSINANVIIVQGVNNAGHTVGSLTEFTGTGPFRTNFVYDFATDTRTDFSIPGGTFAHARGINDLDEIVGYAGINNAFFVGRLGDFSIVSFPDGVPGATTIAYGNNDSGSIVGWWSGADGVTHGFTAVPVPEPTTLALLSMGLAVCAVFCRRGAGRFGQVQAL